MIFISCTQGTLQIMKFVIIIIISLKLSHLKGSGKKQRKNVKKS